MSLERIDRCPMCGSRNLEDESEFDALGERTVEAVKCLDCGSSYGGASYWK
jgi:hypothetical protein